MLDAVDYAATPALSRHRAMAKRTSFQAHVLMGRAMEKEA